MTGDPTRDSEATPHHFGGTDEPMEDEYAAHQREQAEGARAEKGMVLDVDKDAGTVRVSGMPLIERELLRVGSERSAIEHAIRFYRLDRDTARLLVRAVREGQEVDGDG